MLVSQHYGRFIDTLCWSDLPCDVQEKTLDLVSDWIANAAAGFDSKMGKALLSFVPLQKGKGTSFILGNLQEADPLSAALINGAASHALEFDDTYRSGLFHPGAPVISASWAAVGIKNPSGSRFLSSVAAGYEISMRLADTVNPAHNQKWHTTGTVGTFGAAASASLCMGLSAVQAAGALGLAGTQASGLWEILPDFPEAKGLHAGKAAQSGLLAALLAKQDVFGPSTIFEGSRGFFNAMVSEHVNIKTCCEGLGDEWRLTRTTIKAYPVCGHTMTSIEAALKLAKGLNFDEIEKIEVRVHPVSLGIAGNPAPKTELEAKFSIAFCVALALAKRKVTMKEFSAEALSDPTILILISKIGLVADDSLGGTESQRPAKVSLKFCNGRVRSETAKIRKGDPENPLTGQEQKSKFLILVDDVWGRKMGETVFGAVRQLHQYDDFNTWLNENIFPWQKKIQPSARSMGRNNL